MDNNSESSVPPRYSQLDMIDEENIPLKPKKHSGITKWLVLSCLSVCLGSSFQFGYNIGVVNLPQKVMQQWLNDSYYSQNNELVSSDDLNVLWSVCTSIFAIGGMFGALVGGPLAGKVGRKLALMINSIFSIAGAILMGCSITTSWYYLLMIGRFVIGIACGCHTALAPMYLTEVAPLSLRGSAGTLNQFFITIGIFTSEVLGLQQIFGNDRLWSLLLAFTVVPTLVQLATLPFCPESPRYLLIVKQEHHKAEEALKRLRGNVPIEAELKSMADEAANIAALPKVSIRDFHRGHLLWPLLVSVVMMFSQQLCGIVAVLFYSTTILISNAGLHDQDAAYVTLGIGFIFVCMTFVSVVLIDRAGRRILQLVGLVGVWACSLLIFGFLMVPSQWGSYVTVLMIVLFVVFYAVGPGSIPWFFVFEIFEQNAIGIASSFAIAFNWLSLFAAGLMFLPIKDAVGDYCFLVFTGLNTFFILFTWLFAPETRNREIRHIVEDFKTKSYVVVCRKE